MILGDWLDRIAPWFGRIILGLLVILAVIIGLNMVSCSRQEAAQRRQDARSAQAGTKTAGEALDTLEQAQERDAATDKIVADGKKAVNDAKTDVEVDAAARAALCRMSNYRDDPACRVQPVHP